MAEITYNPRRLVRKALRGHETQRPIRGSESSYTATIRKTAPKTHEIVIKDADKAIVSEGVAASHQLAIKKLKSQLETLGVKFAIKLVEAEQLESLISVDTPVTVETDQNVVASGSLAIHSSPGHEISCAVTTAASHGTLTVTDAGLWSYTPDEDFSGEDAAVITVTDVTTETTAQAVFDITVAVAAIDPVLDDLTVSGPKNTTLSGQMVYTAEPGHAVQIYVTGPVPGFLISMGTDGAFTVDSALNYVGTSSAPVQIEDMVTHVRDNATLTFTFTE